MKAELFNYQKVGVDFVKQVSRSALFLDMGLGKALANTGEILTTKGMKTVGEIRVGDYLYSRLGKPTEVLALYEHTNKRAFEVTLKDGRKFTACDEHIIPYYGYAKAVKISNKTLGEMLDDYKITSNQGNTRYKYRIPQNEAVEFETNTHIIHPYVLGTLISDGLFTEKQLSETSEDFVNISSDNELINLKLQKLNSQNAIIPESYMYDSIENRTELLKGFMDTKGKVHVSNNGALRYDLSVNNEKLAKQIGQLCQSLGFGVNVNPYEYDETSKDIPIRIYTSEIIVSSKKHLDKLSKGEYRSTYNKMTPIVDIKEVARQDMTCFTVDNDEQLFLINDYIVTHNTLITLTALTELASEGRLQGHILIIAPKRIAMNTWTDEITKWEHTKNARFKVLAGLTKKKRDEAFDEIESSPSTIYIINRELIPQLVDRFPKEKWAFPNVVIDEAQSFKGYNTVRFKKLRTVIEYTQRVVELTGTPSPNGLMDIWSLIYLLDGGARLGKNITAYREKHFVPGRRTPEGYPYEWLLMHGHADVIHNSIKDVAISMKKEDHLDIPDVTHNTIEMEMTKSEFKIYNQLKKDKILPLLDGGAIESANAAVLSGALLQLSNGAIYADEHRKDIIELHKHKLHALEDIVDGSNGNSILCFYWFRHDLIRLKKHFPDGEVFDGTPAQLARWSNKEIPLLFAQPASAGHGLNFQHGGHILVFFCVPRSLELYQQSIARLHRTGQTEAVIVHYLKMRGTVEDNVITSLMEKQLDQNTLIDAVKAHVADILNDN